MQIEVQGSELNAITLASVLACLWRSFSFILRDENSQLSEVEETLWISLSRMIWSMNANCSCLSDAREAFDLLKFQDSLMEFNDTCLRYIWLVTKWCSSRRWGIRVSHLIQSPLFRFSLLAARRPRTLRWRVSATEVGDGRVQDVAAILTLCLHGWSIRACLKSGQSWWIYQEDARRG